MELFGYTYNEQQVTRKEFKRLKILEQIVAEYFSKINQDYNDWPLVKYETQDD